MSFDSMVVAGLGALGAIGAAYLAANPAGALAVGSIAVWFILE